MRVEVLPERIDGEAVSLRLWRVTNAEGQAAAIAESAAHLRPWMGFMAGPPLSIQARGAMLLQWERDWAKGGDALYAIFVDDAIAGSCGLHRRRGPDTLEIGYWLHPAFVGRGIATTAARLLTDAAFSFPEISRVEIHHDRANVRSSSIPRRLGFRFVGEEPDEAAAPAEVGIDCTWRVDRSVWEGRRHGGRALR
jgi:RimJ/RimL family protein N-acetyltransferase